MQRRAIQIPSGHPPGQPLRLPPRHREGLLPPDRRARRGGPPGPGELRPGDYDFGGAELLTLSACETAVGGAGAQGREVEGPGALAQTKGARGVLATLWPVADASTGRFMQRLYRLHQEGRLTKAEALRRAQLEFLGQNAAAAQPAAGGEAERRPLGLSAAAERAAAPAAPDPARPYAHPTTGPRSS